MRLLLIGLVLVLAVVPAHAQSEAEVRAAVARSLPLLQKSAVTFTASRSCFSCHHNALSILTLRLAQARGFDIDTKMLAAVEDKTFQPLRGPDALDNAIQGANLSDPTPNDSYLLMAAHAADVAPDLVTGVVARRIAHWQRDGHWVTSDFRPPHSSSLFTATATAVQALRYYMPVELAKETYAAIAPARQWLIDTRPVSTEDAAFRLMGLAWANAPKAELASAGRDLLRLQKSDGGWPQLPGYESDAYSTGEALFALHEAGESAADTAVKKGLKFLLSTQARNGAWHVRTRMVSPAEVSPPYFSTGFPYGKDEFLSYAGTCWAVMALAVTLPERAQHGQIPAAPTATEPRALLERKIVFGSPYDLRDSLSSSFAKSGIDPNIRMSSGITPLMLVAPDAVKVRLLLARGADAKARTADGIDALTIAAGYRGAADSLKALLDAGAPADPPEGVHVDRTPLVLASMTGDIDSVRVLLAHGAKASSQALSEAVTFGYADIVEVLVTAGADAMGTESSGINLLHWATITGRSAVIPILAAAGVPINATDQFGFTPLMYAATLDTGPPDLIPTLLKAGADRRIRNNEGRTALDQAKRYKHKEAIDALN